MIVVDASVLVAVLLRAAEAPAIKARLLQAGEPLVATEIIDLEVINALRRNIPQSRSAGEIGDRLLTEYRELSLRRYSHARFLDRIWTLRNNITPYDAAYIALAEYLDAPLLTRDRRLASSTGHTATIELI